MTDHEIVGEDTPLTGPKYLVQLLWSFRDKSFAVEDDSKSDTWFLLIICINSFIQVSL